MITSDVSCRLAEFDFGGIEAVITGRQMWVNGFDSKQARDYIRLAKLGMHAAVTGLAVKRPVDLSGEDTFVKAKLDAIKEEFPFEYDLSKRTVHAKNFGMTVFGQVEKFPEKFPTIAKAQEFEDYYYALAPELPKWHLALRRRARETGRLGGPTLPGKEPSIWDHPYGYIHWFWDVLNYKPINEYTALKWKKDPRKAWRVLSMHGRWFKMDPGGDSNRVIAFYPQSIAAGRLKEAQLALFLPWSDDYIGDAYFGRTPLLGPIHDSLLLHLPNRVFDRVVEVVARVMQRPSTYLPIPLDWGWGEYLPIGVSAKTGKNWAEHVDVDKQIQIKLKYGIDVPLNESGMEKLKLPAWVASAEPDYPVLPREGEGELEEWQALERSVA